MTPIISIQEVEALVEVVRRTPLSIGEGLFFSALFARMIEALSQTVDESPPAE